MWWDRIPVNTVNQDYLDSGPGLQRRRLSFPFFIGATGQKGVKKEGK